MGGVVPEKIRDQDLSRFERGLISFEI